MYQRDVSERGDNTINSAIWYAAIRLSRAHRNNVFVIHTCTPYKGTHLWSVTLKYCELISITADQRLVLSHRLEISPLNCLNVSLKLVGDVDS